MIGRIKDFMKLEAASGLVLMVAAVLALLVANSPLGALYEGVRGPLTLPINDGLMTLFFLAVGIEIKKEFVQGELSSRAKSILPLGAALGGVVMPALIYMSFNHAAPASRGWAIPSATDIAFSLAVLALFGRRVPHSLTIFLMALAIIDDLAAIAIIAVFYTEQLSFAALGIAVLSSLVLFFVGRKGGKSLWLYLLVGAVLWGAVLQSGIHPTIAGVLLAWLMPLRLGRRLLEAIHPWVAFGIMPLFAFVNAGIPLAGLSLEKLQEPVTLGILLGLFIGKQFGIFFAAWLLISLKFAVRPSQASWWELYAVCIMAGIGFTMSLFIGTLAFPDEALAEATRLGVLAGSLFSALAGGLLMQWAMARKGSRA